VTVLPERTSDWLTRRTWDGRRLPAQDALLAAKAGATVTVLIPALDEEPTVGAVVERILGHVHVGDLVDEVVVVDGGSTDRTVQFAAEAGARVVHTADIEPQRTASGKGAAVWRGLLATGGDVVVLLDADVEPFDPNVVAALVAPLLLDSTVHLVKAAAARPLVVGGISHPGAGGRVTELVARPLLNALWPELAGFAQPLSGELAARRDLLERLPVVTGYGLEIAMLVDALHAVGADGLGQVVLGERVHRHHTDAALTQMASAVLRAALSRVSDRPLPDALVQFTRDRAGALEASAVSLPLQELPPIVSLR
jgi:glucosyl-3-phosphoglycerate synthase